MGIAHRQPQLSPQLSHDPRPCCCKPSEMPPARMQLCTLLTSQGKCALLERQFFCAPCTGDLHCCATCADATLQDRDRHRHRSSSKSKHSRRSRSRSRSRDRDHKCAMYCASQPTAVHSCATERYAVKMTLRGIFLHTSASCGGSAIGTGHSPATITLLSCRASQANSCCASHANSYRCSQRFSTIYLRCVCLQEELSAALAKRHAAPPPSGAPRHTLLLLSWSPSQCRAFHSLHYQHDAIRQTEHTMHMSCLAHCRFASGRVPGLMSRPAL